jgi:hypothetical protein
MSVGRAGAAEFERLAAQGAAMPFLDLVRYAIGEVRTAIAELERAGPGSAAEGAP